VTALSPVERRQRRRRRRRQELIRWGIRIGVALLLFLLGVGLGQALHDNPKPGSTVTLERTLRIPTAGNPGSTVTP
jgi:type VI protein secretion system component VasF